MSCDLCLWLLSIIQPHLGIIGSMSNGKQELVIHYYSSCWQSYTVWDNLGMGRSLYFRPVQGYFFPHKKTQQSGSLKFHPLQGYFFLKNPHRVSFNLSLPVCSNKVAWLSCKISCEIVMYISIFFVERCLFSYFFLIHATYWHFSLWDSAAYIYIFCGEMLNFLFLFDSRHILAF